MKKIKVISGRNLATKPPINSTAILWLLLHVTNASGWVRGVCWTLMSILWILFFFSLYYEEFVDIFKNE